MEGQTNLKSWCLQRLQRVIGSFERQQKLQHVNQ